MTVDPFERRRTKSIARGFILALLLLDLYLLFTVFRPFLTSILWAIFLTTAFYPVYRALCRFLRGREWTAALISTALVSLLILFPAYQILSRLVSSLTSLLGDVERIHDGREAVGAMIGRLEDAIGTYVDISNFDLHAILRNSIESLKEILLEHTKPFVQNVFRTLFQFLIMVFTMVVLFREGGRVIQVCHKSLPLSAPDRDAVFHRLHDITRAVFYGVMLTALVQASLGTIGWIIVGLPSALTFGTLMFFSALVPFGGTTLIWGPGVAYLLFTGATGKGIFLLLWGALVVSLIDNFLKPIFISGRIRMHLLLVFFGTFGGLAAFGLSGLFLGPMIIAMFMFLLEVIRRDLFPQEDKVSTP